MDLDILQVSEPKRGWYGPEWTSTQHRVPLDWRMIAAVYAKAAFIILAIIGAFALLDRVGW